MAFIYFTTAFDNLNRGKLWAKLAKWHIYQSFLNAVINLYSNTWVRVRQTSQCITSGKIAVSKELKQGCILAPLLFNLYLANISNAFKKTKAFELKKIDILQNADGTILLHQTRIGLQRQLDD